jgi:hypothetical protein
VEVSVEALLGDAHGVVVRLDQARECVDQHKTGEGLWIAVRERNRHRPSVTDADDDGLRGS